MVTGAWYNQVIDPIEVCLPVIDGVVLKNNQYERTSGGGGSIKCNPVRRNGRGTTRLQIVYYVKLNGLLCACLWGLKTVPSRFLPLGVGGY